MLSIDSPFVSRLNVCHRIHGDMTKLDRPAPEFQMETHSTARASFSLRKVEPTKYGKVTYHKDVRSGNEAQSRVSPEASHEIGLAFLKPWSDFESGPISWLGSSV